MKHTTIPNRLAIALVAALGLYLTPAARGSDKGCSKATLNGTFAYTNTGFITAPPSQAGPFAGVGTQTFDGTGSTTASAWVSVNGNTFQVTIKGTYTVNPDCTGTFTFQISVLSPPMSLPPAHAFFVIDEGGAEIRAINTDPGQAVTTTAKRQFPAGDWRQ
jgi:hypothetical protein